MPRPGLCCCQVTVLTTSPVQPQISALSGLSLPAVSLQKHTNISTAIYQTFGFMEKNSFADSFETMCHSFSNTNKNKKEKL